MMLSYFVEKNLLYGILSVLLFVSNAAYSKKNRVPGSPILKNYVPVEYKAHGQNWDIIQDEVGLIYFANSNGILEFDGLLWRKYDIPNQLVRALAIDENSRVYVGGVDELGYLERNSLGRKKYFSLKNKIPNDFRDFGHVWKIWLIQNKVIFQTYSHIIAFSKTEKKELQLEQIVPAGTSFHRSFILNGQLYILQREVGLSRYEDGKLIQLKGTQKLSDAYLYAAIQFSPTEKKILLGFIPDGFYWFDGKQLEPFKTEVDDVLFRKNRYLSALAINTDEFAVGTLSEGCLILNRKGELVKRINEKDGLQNPTVFTLFKCKNNYLWMGLDHGISRIDLNAPLEVIDNRSGIWGVPSSVCFHDSTLYIGTGVGVFYCNLKEQNKSKPQFLKLFESSDQCWAIEKRKNSVVVANRLGLYEVFGRKIQPIKTGWSFEKAGGSSPYSLYKMPVDTSFGEFWLVGLLDGLAVLIRDEKGWKDLGKIPGIDFEVRSIGVDHTGDYWLASSYQGLYRVCFKKLFPKPEIEQTWHYVDRSDISNYWVSFIEYRDTLLFVDKKGFHYFDYETGQFKSYAALNGNLFNNGVVANKAVRDERGNLWVSAFRGDELVLFRQSDFGSRKQWVPFTNFPLSQIVSPFAAIVDLEFSGKPLPPLWMATSEGVLQFELPNQAARVFPVKERWCLEK